MKKNGFIATSLIYSFFLVFIAIIATLLNSYIASKTILDRYNEEITNDLNGTTFSLIVQSKNANIDGGKLFKCAYEVNRMFTFEYKAKKVHMKLRVNDNSWINDVIKIIESYNK